MLNSILAFFDTNGFPPRWQCGVGWEHEPWIGWAHICADVATFGAYYAVPLVVAFFVLRKPGLKFPPSFWLFLGLVFFSCGTVHLVEAGIFWWPHYRLSGVLKILTATVSCVGVFVLARSLPAALDLKSPDELALEVETRRAAERKLAFERHLLDSVMANLPEAVYIKDRSGQYLRVSQKLSELLGARSPDDVSGKTDFEFFAREEAEFRRSDQELIFETGEPIVNRIRQLVWPDGSRRWDATTQFPLRLDNELIGTFGISHDVSEIRQVQQQLSDFASKLALPRNTGDTLAEPIPLSEFSLQHMINCGSWIRGLNQKCDSRQQYSDAVVEFLFRELVDDAGQAAFGLVRLFRTRLFSDLSTEQQQAATTAAGDLELHPDTPCLTLISTAGVDEAWNDPGRSAGHRAIPLPSKRAIEQLPMIAQLFRQLGFDADGIVAGATNFVVDKMQTGVFHVAEASGSGFIPAQDFVQKYGIRSVVGFGDTLPCGELFAVICFSRVPISREVAVLFSHLSISARLGLLGYQADDENHVESQIMAVDQLVQNYEQVVCEQEQKLQSAMHDVERARDAANEANRAKSDFLANMSHEIRTPMNAIIGMTELVLDSELESSQRDYLETVLESGESLLSIINEILDFSKIEAGIIELESVSFDLREELGDMIRSLAQRAHKKHLELAWEIMPEVPSRVIGDPLRLRQIIVNLVGNAIKFTQVGEVVISVEVLSVTETDAELKFLIKDTGVGIPADRRDAIFNAFEQADTSTTRRFGGTGLGLAISSTLVQAMGGRIEVTSEVGKGSCFALSLRFECGGAAQVPDRVPASVRGLTAMVVDDNETNRRILEEMLQSWGVNVVLAEGARSAMEYLRARARESKAIPIVVTDVHMPDVDGYKFAEQIRNDRQLAATQIVVLTSGSRPGDMKLCEDLGIRAHLMKPVKQSELLDAIMVAAGAESQGAATLSADTRKLKHSRSLHILLAEDGTANQQLALGLLKRFGHQVTVANDGREAVDQWESGSFDLILMDIQMPNLDGLEATQEIRSKEEPGSTPIPIIAMTAHAMKGDRERCLDAGMTGYVSKPVRRNELFVAIAESLDEESVAVADKSSAIHIPETEQSATVESDPAPADQSDGAIHMEPASYPEVDWDMAVKAMSGDRELLVEVVAAVIEECPKLLQQLQEAQRSGDVVTLKRMAHTIKGSMRLFHVSAITDLAESIEHSPEEAIANDERVQRLIQLVEGVVPQFKDFHGS